MGPQGFPMQSGAMADMENSAGPLHRQAIGWERPWQAFGTACGEDHGFWVEQLPDDALDLSNFVAEMQTAKRLHAAPWG